MNWDNYNDDEYYFDDYNEDELSEAFGDAGELNIMSPLDAFEADREDILQAVIDEYFGGVPKDEIVFLLQQHYPENFTDG